MRTFTGLFLLLAAISFLCLNTTCKRKVKISYEGVLYDSVHAVQKHPVANTTIHLSYCDGKISSGSNACHGSLHKVASAITDASGHFSISQTVRMEYNSLYITIDGNTLYYGDTRGYGAADLPGELYMHFD